MFGDPFVYAFVTAANQDDALQLGESPSGFLAEHGAGRGKQNDRGTLAGNCGRAQAFSRGEQRFHRGEQRLGLHHHALAAAERTVVDGAMTIVRERAQIMNVRLDQIRFACAAHDTVIERTTEELREYGDQIKSHWDLSYRNTRRVGALQNYFVFTSSKPSGRIASMRRATRSTLTQMSCARGISISLLAASPARAASSVTTSNGVPKTFSPLISTSRTTPTF